MRNSLTLLTTHDIAILLLMAVVISLILGTLLGAYLTRQRTAINRLRKFGESKTIILQTNIFNDPPRQSFTESGLIEAALKAANNKEDFE